MSAVEVVELSAEETHPLRLAVLRHDTPTKEVSFAEDSDPGALHLGLRVAGELVAVSTWIPRPHNDQPAIQLRGMATARQLQGTGLGGKLLEAGCQRATTTGARLVWARARDTALDFYMRHGFEVEGAGFIDATTNLPHHLVIRQLVVP
ncbi:MAG: GNAT family N-acetyltransferase [Actinomycetia bacterium]|nr:GNAT family N-acetyltransferase [Actinomycetes bacterium]